MITNLNQQFNNYPAVSFTSRSSAIKKADEICRRTRKEFSSVYSNSKIYSYQSLGKDFSFKNLLKFTEQFINDYRRYYEFPEKEEWQFMRELAGLKKHKVGNCGEMADATKLALDLNGYKDVEILNLYAYNPKTNEMRDLDHTVAGINFKIPNTWNKYKIKGQDKLKSMCKAIIQNDSIIIDSWAGITEFAKEIKNKYNHNQNFIKGTKQEYSKPKEVKQLLEPEEQLCFISELKSYQLKELELASFGKKYPKLILKNNPNAVDILNAKDLPEITEISKEDVLKVKQKYLVSQATKPAEATDKDNVMKFYQKYNIIFSRK